MLRRYAIGFFLGCLVSTPVLAQVTINLESMIGPTGTNAATVAGLGNHVNLTSAASNVGPTTLTAPGSANPVSFDFNTGFADSVDRAIGSTAGAPNVWVNLKYDSAITGPLILDATGDGGFSDEVALTGFGMHADTFITLDLDAIRTTMGVSAGTQFVLTGLAGIANAPNATSAAILADGNVRAVFDWTSGPGNLANTFSITLSGSERYLTFAALAGGDGDHFYAHVGFANLQLQAVPEPSTWTLLGAGVGALAFLSLRKRRV